MSQSSLRTPNERLRYARVTAGYDSAAKAARAIGVPYQTYANHENSGRGLSRVASRYATFYRISLDWLLNGRGDMRGRAGGAPLWGTVGAGAAVLPVHDDGSSEPLEILDLPTGKDTGALRVTGQSQYPRFEAGEVILFETLARTPAQLVGGYCMVETEDGRRLVKKLRRGSGPGLFDLESHNAPPERDVKLTSAFRIIGVLL